MGKIIQLEPAAVVRPANKEARLLASQIKRPPARRLAEALLVQFPDIEVAVADGGFSAAVRLHGTAIALCETFSDERDGREGWYTLMDRAYPQLVALFSQVEAQHRAIKETEKEAPPRHAPNND